MLDDKEKKKKENKTKRMWGRKITKGGGGGEEEKQQQPKHINTQPLVGSNMHSQPAELAVNETDYFRGKETQTV